jgi:hypothetical protein
MPLPAWAVFGAAGLGYKIYQALTDEIWPGTEFPEEFRKRIIDSHLAWWGNYCKGCCRWDVCKSDLSVDHIVPIRHGGKNSKHNAQVLCIACNSRKQDNYSMFDAFSGRGGGRPRIRE